MLRPRCAPAEGPSVPPAVASLSLRISTCFFFLTFIQRVCRMIFSSSFIRDHNINAKAFIEALRLNPHTVSACRGGGDGNTITFPKLSVHFLVSVDNETFRTKKNWAL